MAISSENIAPGFAAPDKTDDPSFYVQFLRYADSIADVGPIRETMRRQMKIEPGHRILDVGCGIGGESRALAEIVGPGGQVNGLDVSETLVNVAAESSRENRGGALRFAVGDVHHLDFPENAFDSCRSERVFMYLREPRMALDEMIRVTRPGGRVVIYDFEWDSFYVTGSQTMRSRKIHRNLADKVQNGHIGSELVCLFRDLNLVDVELTPAVMRFPLKFYHFALNGLILDAVKSGAFSEKEISDWWRDLESADKQSLFHSGMLGFIVAGTKPI